jgi:hypothetical protein
MSETKFTPGPWFPSETKMGKGKVVDDKGFSVANCSASTYAQQNVDSHLIAAAPELYEALEPFASFACDEPHVGEPECNNCKARAALAKARGEQ